MASRLFSVGGRSTATAATVNHAGAQLWNASASKSLYVSQIGWSKTVGTADAVAMVRTTARGTAGSTVTPVQQNDASYDAAPSSGALLDLAAFTVQPTIVSTAAPMLRWMLPAAVGSGFILPIPGQIEVPAGTGLALITPVATILQPSDVTFWWQE